MRIARVLLTLMFAFAFSTTAFSLEETGTLKATTLLKTTQSWDGKSLAFPQGQAEITALLVEIAPGGETGWHSHPVPSFGMVLEGELEVRLKSGELKHVKAGEAIAEVVDTTHNGRNVGKVPLKFVVFYAGEVGKEVSVKEAQP